MAASTKLAMAGTLAGALALLAATSVLAIFPACNQADLRGPTDAEPDPELERIETRDCPVSPFALCDAMPPGAGGCIGEPERADAASSTIPTDASFPVGCTVNIPSTYRTPQGECLVAYACRCKSPEARSTGGDASVASQWACIR